MRSTTAPSIEAGGRTGRRAAVGSALAFAAVATACAPPPATHVAPARTLVEAHASSPPATSLPSTPPSSVAHEPPPASSGAAASDPQFAAALTREPKGDGACLDPRFPKFYVASGRTTIEELYLAVWLDHVAHERVPPVGPDEASAVYARCFASGPHTAYNAANWCCR